MDLRMEFDSGVGPTCLVYFYIFSTETNRGSENFGNTFESLLDVISKYSCV